MNKKRETKSPKSSKIEKISRTDLSRSNQLKNAKLFIYNKVLFHKKSLKSFFTAPFLPPAYETFFTSYQLFAKSQKIV